MILEGRIYKYGKFWLAEVPGMDAMTQGLSRANAIKMLKSLLQEMLEGTGAKAEIAVAASGNTLVKVPETKQVIGLILRRLRAKSGLSLEDVRVRLRAKSRNEFSMYEQGKREPSMAKLSQLIGAVDLDHALSLVLRRREEFEDVA